MNKKRLHALITGGSNGIGAATATLFAQAGYAVTIFYHQDHKNAKEIVSLLTAEGYEIQARCVDIRKKEEVQLAVSESNLRYGAVDVLVSNAGIGSWKLFTDIADEEITKVIDVHIYGMINIVRAVLPGMISRKTGKIITVSSIWGMTGASCEVIYSTAKAAVIGFTKALAKEVGPSNIHVNCVAPGVVSTRMNQALSEEDLSVLRDETPLGRIGQPEEIAECIFFLASDKASFFTGQVLSPNGGLVI